MVLWVVSAALLTSQHMLPDEWIEHRREDREPVGWIVPDGEGFRPVDRLGRWMTSG